MADYNNYLRELPAVDRLLREPVLDELCLKTPRRVVIAAVQQTLASYRRRIQQAAEGDAPLDNLNLTPAALAREAAALSKRSGAANLRPVINATGIVLHTNLGRAPLAASAAKALAGVADSFSNLEYDLDSGQRGSRQAHLEALLCELTGAEASVVVNNNAAAVLLVLNTLASGKEVIVSRGELVEIGGSFRIPEVITAGGARLIEVGTTNKTYLHDYEAALSENTAALLKVHTSNYHIVGFTASATARELVALGRSRKLPVIEDLGSGVLLDLARYNLPPEPRVQDCVSAGIDIVTFSGDKLFGGPQAGMIVGKRDWVERIRRNQLARALRVDKFTVAALEATLRLYLDEEKAVCEIPVWRMLTASSIRLCERAESLARRLEPLFGKDSVEVCSGASRVGGGALPTAELPTSLVVVNPSKMTPAELAERLRVGPLPVVARVQHDRLLLDLRTVEEEREEGLIEAMSIAYQADREE